MRLTISPFGKSPNILPLDIFAKLITILSDYYVLLYRFPPRGLNN